MGIQTGRRRVRLGAVAAVAAAVALFGAAAVHAAPSATRTNSFSGRAYAVGITQATGALAPLDNTFICDTGQLPAAGGSRPGTNNCLPVAGTITFPSMASACATSSDIICLDALAENTSGAGNTAKSTSHVAFVRVLPDQVTSAPCLAGGKVFCDLLSATVLTADTSVSCNSSGAPVKSATTTVTSLTIAGQNVPIPTDPNTVVNLGPSGGPYLATVTMRHEDTSAPNTAVGDALIITFPAGSGGILSAASGVITISHAESDITCGPLIAKTANGSSSATVAAGEDVTYGVTVTNHNQMSCKVTSVTDFLPPQPGQAGVPFTFVSGGPPNANRKETRGGNGQHIETWTGKSGSLGALAPGQSLAFDFVAHVPSSEPAATYDNSVKAVLVCGGGSGSASTTASTTAQGLAPVTVTGVAGIDTAAPLRPVPWIPLGVTGLGLALLGAAGFAARRLLRSG